MYVLISSDASYMFSYLFQLSFIKIKPFITKDVRFKYARWNRGRVRRVVFIYALCFILNVIDSFSHIYTYIHCILILNYI